MPSAKVVHGVWLVIAITGATLSSWTTFYYLSRSQDPPIIKVQPISDVSLASPDLQTFIDALALIDEKAIFLGQSRSLKSQLQETIQTYLRHMDPYSSFLPPDRAARMKELRSGHYVGIAMDIERTKIGKEVRCFPYPGGAAAAAGVHAGDTLLAVNDVTVADLPLSEIAMLSMVPQGQPIKLTVSRAGTVVEVIATASEVAVREPDLLKMETLPVISIPHFASTTPNILLEVLQNVRDRAIVIDLRGNQGGDFYAAVDSAKLFLNKGDRIVSIISRSGVKDYRADSDGEYASRQIYLWQDKQTASAAEVFIAALRDNHHGISVGQQTYGKASKQDVLALGDGSVMILSTGVIVPPGGKRYDDVGLKPDFLLEQDMPIDTDFLSRTSTLVRDH